MTANEALMIAGMALVTFGIRYPMLVLVGRVALPPMVADALRFVPVAVLAAICVPAVLMPRETLWLGLDNAWLVAGVLTVLVSWRTKNLLATIVIGMGVFLLLRVIFNV
jgi:branched-subunit amino acid transport protein